MLSFIEVPKAMVGKRVVVTGATGFVGRHFLEALLEAGVDVVAIRHKRSVPAGFEDVDWIDVDLLHIEECEALLECGDWIIHAAGSVGSAAVGPVKMMSSIRENLFLACNMLEAAWKKEADRILLFSSSTGYPASDEPVAEEDFWSGPVYDGYFGYGWMRRYQELIGEFSYRSGGLKVAACRPTAVYGRHDNFDLASCHVIPALVNRAVSGESPYVVWGDGSEVRDFLHVEDLVRGSLKLLDSCTGFTPMNIAFGSSGTVAEAVDIILEAAGRERDCAVYDPDKPVAMPVRRVDGAKAEKELNFKPEITLREGLADLVNWYAGQLKKQGNGI